MARCHLVIGLCVLHLCLAFAYPGFQYDPNLIPQAAPQYYPQQNPYAQYPSPYPMYEGPGAYYPQPGYGQQPVYGDREVFIQENEEQTPTDTGASEPTSSGTNVPADTAVVQTPSQTEDSTGSSSPSTPTTNSNMDALDIQLAAALEAVKADMISKGKQVLEEKQWTDDVKAVIEQYTKKISNVYANIEKLKKDMGDLYRKKQQIINAQIQKQLTAKLKDSKSDLQTVQAALDKVTNTQMEFEQSKKDIQSTIDSIFTQLAELKGQPAPAASGETPAAGTDAKAGGTDSTKSGSEASSTDSQSSDAAASSDSSSSDSETDIVDRTAEINSKIDTIKSIVSALNKGSSSSL